MFQATGEKNKTAEMPVTVFYHTQQRKVEPTHCIYVYVYEKSLCFESLTAQPTHTNKTKKV